MQAGTAAVLPLLRLTCLLSFDTHIPSKSHGASLNTSGCSFINPVESGGAMFTPRLHIGSVEELQKLPFS